MTISGDKSIHGWQDWDRQEGTEYLGIIDWVICRYYCGNVEVGKFNKHVLIVAFARIKWFFYFWK